jgi:thiosulfate/3-mercaptopyruvate sulfurtransferase
MSSSATPLSVSPSQLLALSPLRVSILDASWFMPSSPRNPSDEYLSKRIPGAQLLNLDEVASPHELGLKHMMPKERLFADACGTVFLQRVPYGVVF